MNRIKIKYCRPCGYLRHAEALASKLGGSPNSEVELVPGNFGVFKIWCDGQLVFDKRDSRGILGKLGFGYLPSPDFLADLVCRKVGRGSSPSP